MDISALVLYATCVHKRSRLLSVAPTPTGIVGGGGGEGDRTFDLPMRIVTSVSRRFSVIERSQNSQSSAGVREDLSRNVNGKFPAEKKKRNKKKKEAAHLQEARSRRSLSRVFVPSRRVSGPVSLRRIGLPFILSFHRRPKSRATVTRVESRDHRCHVSNDRASNGQPTASLTNTVREGTARHQVARFREALLVLMTRSQEFVCGRNVFKATHPHRATSANGRT